jgi:type II secretory pathway component PulF
MSSTISAPDKITPITLTTAEAESLARLLSDAMRGGVDLPQGLRRIAEQQEFSRIAPALRLVADDLERGSGLDAFAHSDRLRSPATLVGLIAAASHGREQAAVLGELLDVRERRWEQHRQIFKAVAYPLVMVVLTLVGLGILFNLFVPSMAQIIREFELKVGDDTRAMMWLADQGQWPLWIGIAFFPTILAIAWLFLPKSIFHRVVATIPLWGKLHWWLGAEQWLRSLAVIVEQRVPLPVALQLTANVADHGMAAAASHELASAVEQGADFAAELAKSNKLPRMIAAYAQAGMRRDQLGESLRAAADVLADWSAARTHWLIVVPSICMFVLIPALLIRMYELSFWPMIALLSGLSGFARGGGPTFAGGGASISSACIIAATILLLPAVAIWFAYKVMAGDRENQGWPLVMLRITMWVTNITLVMMLAGALAGLAFTWFFPMTIAAIIWLALQARATARRGMLWHFALAAEQRIPLFEAAYACGSGRGNPLAKKCVRLARHLEAGTPILPAMRQAGIALSLDDRTAISTAAQSGHFGKILHQYLARQRDIAMRFGFQPGQLLYLLLSGFTSLFLMSYVMIKVVPVLARMMDEFNIRADWLWVLFLRLVINLPFLFIGVPFVFLIIGALTEPTARKFLGAIFASIFGISRRRAGGIVARTLANLLPLGWSVERSLASLTQQNPEIGQRLRVAPVYRALESGVPPIDAMRKAGWFSASETAALTAAARVGNLPFAFEQIADRRDRRDTEKSRFMMHLFSNLSLLIALAAAGMFAWLVFGPLIGLIKGLVP